MEITPNVYQLDCTKTSHVYAICSADGVTLIDSSFPGLGNKIMNELAGYGIKPGDIKRILLTHRDTDHIGNAAQIQAETGCEIFISEQDLQVALGSRRAPGLKGFTSLFIKAKCPPDTKILTGESIDGIEIIRTPGHTPGHCCFKWKNLLFLGDLVFSTRDRLRLAPSVYIEDKVRNAASMGSIDISDVDWLCPAHGDPICLSKSQPKKSLGLMM